MGKSNCPSTNWQNEQIIHSIYINEMIIRGEICYNRDEALKHNKNKI